MDMGRLNSKEGIIVLVAAVVDDIIGLVILSIVVSVSSTGEFHPLNSVLTGIIGFVVWAALLAIGVFGHKFISRFLLGPFKKSGTLPIFALIIGIIISYLVTLVDLHPVVGAYAAGLMFASTVEREDILRATHSIMLFLAPFFFAYLGMQVDLLSIWEVIIPALVLVVLAIIGKIGGCYVPARLAGKVSHTGGMIVGVGMVPRGEVGLIIAGAGLMTGAIGREVFGIAVAVSILTVLVVPAMLKPLFRRSAKADKPKLPQA
jgi:Kef-type K+ transport system membrane component KefB